MPPRRSGPAAVPDVVDADDLYGLDPAGFVAARDALARFLRASGDRDAAAEVASRRRPPRRRSR